MNITIGALLALSFLISVLGLFMFVWAQMNGLMRAGPDAAGVIFADGEVGLIEDLSLSLQTREPISSASRMPPVGEGMAMTPGEQRSPQN